MESFLSDVHARDDIHELEVAFDQRGQIIAVKDHLMADGGAYASYPFSGAIGETSLATKVITGPYDIAHLSTVIDCTYFQQSAPGGVPRGLGPRGVICARGDGGPHCPVPAPRCRGSPPDESGAAEPVALPQCGQDAL